MIQVNVTLTETIKVLLEEKKYSTLRDILTTMKPFDIAAVFEELQDEKTPILFRILPKELAAETFVEMDEDTQEFLIHGFSDNELKEVVDELFVDDAVDLIEEMPANVVKRILRQADKDGIVREGAVLINHAWDYFSEKDGEVHHFDLCESCYDEMISQFKIPVDVEEQTELI